MLEYQGPHFTSVYRFSLPCREVEEQSALLEEVPKRSGGSAPPELEVVNRSRPYSLESTGSQILSRSHITSDVRVCAVTDYCIDTSYKQGKTTVVFTPHVPVFFFGLPDVILKILC